MLSSQRRQGKRGGCVPRMAGALGPAVCYPIRTLECTSLRVETGDWTALSHGLLAGLLLRSFLSVLPFGLTLTFRGLSVLGPPSALLPLH